MEQKSVEIILFIVAIMILAIGIGITIYTSTPIFEQEIIEILSTTPVMQGVVTVNVVKGEANV